MQPPFTPLCLPPPPSLSHPHIYTDLISSLCYLTCNICRSLSSSTFFSLLLHTLFSGQNCAVAPEQITEENLGNVNGTLGHVETVCIPPFQLGGAMTTAHSMVIPHPGFWFTKPFGSLFVYPSVYISCLCVNTFHLSLFQCHLNEGSVCCVLLAVHFYMGCESLVQHCNDANLKLPFKRGNQRHKVFSKAQI